MVYSHPLVGIYHFLQEMLVFDGEPTLEFISKLNVMYSRGWIYASYLDNRVMAVAGAFRIKEWDEKHLTQIPEKEEGNILFILFFACASDNATIPLKFLKQHLKENPSIEKIVYCKKIWLKNRLEMKTFTCRSALKTTLLTRPHEPSRTVIYPPALVKP